MNEVLFRFRGALVALVILLVVGIGYISIRGLEPGSDLDAEHHAELFQFEKEDLTGIKVVRRDTTIELQRQGGEWKVVGDSWKPSRSMVRRVAHQIHDLTARAKVVDDIQDGALFGLGPDAIEVTLTLEGREPVRFKAGDPNPSSVSFYIQPLPGETVYVVKKAAIDYYALKLEEFRERRFASLDADLADTIDATVDGRTLQLHRTGDRTWRMDAPVAQDASREEVRTMLGRTGALKATEFVEDGPADKAKYGLEPPEATVKIGMSDGETITLLMGDPVEGHDRPHRYVYRVEDDVVYLARDGFLEAFGKSIEDYRNRAIVGRRENEIRKVTAHKRGAEPLAVSRDADGWKWPDGSPVPGSTPRRLAQRVGDLEARDFHDDPGDLATYGLEDPEFTLTLDPIPDAGEPIQIDIGSDARFEPPPPVFDEEMAAPPGMEPPAPIVHVEERRRFARVGPAGPVYEIDEGLVNQIEDLFREYGKKLERDEEKQIRDAAGAGPDPSADDEGNGR